MKRLDRERLLIELNNNNFEIFIYNYNTQKCILELKDDEEILIKLSDNIIPKERMNLLRHILQNYESYIQKALKYMKIYNIDIGNDYDVYGIYVGEFTLPHETKIIDGFTITLERWTEENLLTTDLFSVQFTKDGIPQGISLWFM